MDGRWVATLGNDHSARVWDATTGQELARLRGASDAIAAVAFTASDTLIALRRSGRIDQLACELCTAANALLQLAARRTFRPPTQEERRRYRLEDEVR